VVVHCLSPVFIGEFRNNLFGESIPNEEVASLLTERSFEIADALNEKLTPIWPGLLKTEHRGIELTWVEAVDRYHVLVIVDCPRERFVIVEAEVGTKPDDSGVGHPYPVRDVTTSIPSPALEANVILEYSANQPQR